MTVYVYEDQIIFHFEKHVPGDRFRYRNVLQLPTLHGLEICVVPKLTETFVSVFCDKSIHDEIIAYVGLHKDKGSKKFTEVR